MGLFNKGMFLNWRGYLVAIGAVALATWLKYLAQPSIIPADVPILYILAIVPTAIFFGFGPSILVCVLSLLAYDYYFIPPLYTVGPRTIQFMPILVIFLLVGILFSYLASDLRRKNKEAIEEISARKKAEAELAEYQEHLEEQVRQRTSELEKANLDLKQEITERKQAEEALRESEQRWATTLTSIGDAVIATDAGGSITFMNAVAESLTGWAVSEASNKPITEVFDIINEQTRQKVENPVIKVLQQGTIVGLANHTILVCKDRSEIAIDDSGAPIKDEEGKITGVVLIFRDITERKQLEEAIEYERDKLNDILNSMEDGVYIVNQNYDIEYINPALESTFGPVKGQKCYRYFHNQEQVCPWCKNLEIFQGRHVHWELHFSKLNRVYDMTGTPSRNPDGRTLVQEILHDITERKQAEESLKLSEERLKRSQEIAHLGSWELDPANNSLSWSDEVYRIFGLKPQEFEATYEAFLDAVHPDDRAAVDAAYSGSLREGKDSYDIEHRVVRKSTGEIHYVHEKCTHIRDESGKIIRSIGMAYDITERKRAEQELLRLNRELRAITDCSQAIVRSTDERTLFTDVCHIICEAVGYRMAWIGAVEHDEAKSIRPVAWYGDDNGYLEKASITWADTEFGRGSTGIAARTGKTDFCQDFVTELKAAPWRERALTQGFHSSIAIPLFDNQGSVFAVFTLYAADPNGFTPAEVRLLEELAGDVAFGIGVLRTKQERVRAEEELKQRTVELEAANKELEAFSYSVSHDLRAPLRALDGFSQAVIEDCGEKLGEQGKDYLNRVRNASQLMSRLIDDMLKLSRITRTEMHFDRVNLSDTVKSIAEELKAGRQERQVEFIIAPEVTAVGDAGLLRSMIHNLLENAWKFTDKCSRARIEFGVNQKDGQMLYFVRDNGAGFDMKYADKLFQPFQRLHSVEDYPGTGIGLAIIQRIIRRHGGRIWAEGETDKGATFYFTLSQD